MNELKHLGIILDGNRRLAKRLQLQPWKGHEMGAGKVEKLFQWARDLGIEELTLYALSIDNFSKRPEEELKFLYGIFRKEFEKLRDDERLIEEGVRIHFIGRREMLPEDMQQIMKDLEDKTVDNDKYRVNFALAYGGREEIVDSVKKIAVQVRDGCLEVEDIDKETINNHLDLPRHPQLIIRTGGEFRTSNFLVWQSAYSEWYVLKKFWPEFEKDDLVRAKDSFENRDIRLGK